MKKSKVDQAYEYITGINRNYPDWPATFNTCTKEGCAESARGIGLCANCHEAELAKYVGTGMASMFHDIAKMKARCISEILDEVRSKQ